MLSDKKSMPLFGLEFEKQVEIIKSTKQVHSKWYRETYPDVAALKLDPAVHYLRYGASMGRDPGKNFQTNFYLSTYPDAASSGLNPLVHYALYGHDLGYARRGPKKSLDLQQVPKLRNKLLSLGFTEAPLSELAEIARNSDDQEARTVAARDMALWYMRQGSRQDYNTALEYLQIARGGAPRLDFRRRLAVAELLCYVFQEDYDGGMACFERALRAGELSADLLLAKCNLRGTPLERIELINRAMALDNLPPITLMPEDGRPAYERLASATPLERVEDGPKVTVLIAAYEAEHTLPTALRSLQEQTWQNLEIIVLDDCSPSPGTARVAEQYAASDNRIKLVRMERNGGAYVARNRGLDLATGKYVTLHDADDWSHPLKIETQARYLEAHPDVMGCTSQQARATETLEFPKWAGPHGAVAFCKENVSSFMQRHEPVFEKVGYWDPVRFGADSEKIRRIKAAFGEERVVSLETGPLSFQRISSSSIVSDGAFGVDGFFFGARLAYFEAQLEQHNKSIKYSSPDKTNFAVPQVMHPERSSRSKHFDVIIVSDFRMHGGSTRSSIEEMMCQRRAGLRTGVVQMNRYDYPANKRVLPEVLQVFDSDMCLPIAYGESVTCDLMIVRYPPVLEHLQRYIPNIDAATIRVVINQPPMSDYGPTGERRYSLKNCANNIRQSFGKDAVWHPIGPLVRDALHQHHADELPFIALSNEDWSNIIDVEGWERASNYRENSSPMRIGRHSRDSEHKWPANADDILAAYPSSSDVEVHILGGAESVLSVIKYIPDNWKVHEFGSMSPKEFLKELDVWIYFAHPDWVESFGRTIIEAMAAGIPVILPDVYRPLFGDAALYATPQTAVTVAQELWADKDSYVDQVCRAKRYVKEKFSYDLHLERVAAVSREVGQKGGVGRNAPRFETMTALIGIQNAPADVGTDVVSDHSPSPSALHIEAAPKIPQHSGKTSAKSLVDIPVIDLLDVTSPPPNETTLMQGVYSGHRFDYLWHPKSGSNRLFVLFSGDARRGKNDPPVFQRWSWAEHFPGHCLYVSDPMLHMADNLGLAWYAGTDEFDPMGEIIRRIDSMLPCLGLSNQDVIAYGSSGGGFAALRMLTQISGANAIAINPQINIANFNRGSPDKYARTCLKRGNRKIALADFPERMDLLRHVPTLRHRNIILIQNRLDVHHYEDHYSPFCHAMGSSVDENTFSGNFRRILFDHVGGHGKAETPEAFAAAMRIVQSGFASRG